MQDEPQNQGAWSYLSLHVPPVLGRQLRVVSRAESAATATGSAKKHAVQQTELIAEAFAR